jgi:predicted transposase/invertase (TIGR01784 family)
MKKKTLLFFSHFFSSLYFNNNIMYNYYRAQRLISATSRNVHHYSSSKTQIYSIPTFDAAFKWILSDKNIRLSFLNAFIPNAKIEDSKQLDNHMNPLIKLQNIRDFVNDKENAKVIKDLINSGAIVMKPPAAKIVGENKEFKIDDKATAFLTKILINFDEIKASFPKQRYNGTMDLVCELDSGDYALVEMQVIQENCWDTRALAYVAAFFGNQLSRGEGRTDIKKVIGLNILGGGIDDIAPWKNEKTPEQFIRHYKFEDQLNGKNRFIEGMELIQYSILDAHSETDQVKQDWYTFFKEARYMSEEEVKTRIKTPAVLQAFERAKISKLPEEVQNAYKAQDQILVKYSDRIAEARAEAGAEAIKKIALNCLNIGLSVEEVAKLAGLSDVEVIRLKNGN